jgi:hypothetical protein
VVIHRGPLSITVIDKGACIPSSSPDSSEECTTPRLWQQMAQGFLKIDIAEAKAVMKLE